MRSLTPPVFCDHCSCLALAVIDGEIACTACLLERAGGGNPTASIHPLPLTRVGPDRPAQPTEPTGEELLEAG